MIGIHPKQRTLWVIAILLGCLAALPGSATTLQRAGLEELVQRHDTIVVAKVTHTFSYWNDDHSMILTDVTVAPDMVLKGRTESGPLTLTLLGGTVDDTTVAIVAGAKLQSGKSYLLFLAEANLSAGRRHLTVREHSQGVFDFVLSESGELRAVSQANGAHLVQDAKGRLQPPGGLEGLAQGDILETIATLVARGDH